jgi:hypothetical protein
MKRVLLDATELPDRLRPGREVVHDTFGKGVMRSYRLHKGHPALEIDFNGTIKLLSAEFGIPHLRPASEIGDGNVVPTSSSQEAQPWWKLW